MSVAPSQFPPPVDSAKEFIGPPTDADARNRELMRSAVGEVDVEVRAEAGAVKLPLAEVLAMKPGDTIRSSPRSSARSRSR